MSTQKYKNALIYNSKKKCFEKGGFVVNNGWFEEIKEIQDAENAIDMNGKKIIPGLVDMHTHGRGGVDFISATVSQMREMKMLYAEKGVTTVVPTLASDTFENMLSAILRVKEAGFHAVHIEGRYLNPNRRGAHNSELICKLNSDEACDILKCAEGIRLHVSAAYELDTDGKFLSRLISGGATAGLGHTDASYEEACRLVKNGVSSFTHLFNAMPPVHHRNGGASVAGLLSDAYVEIICDGFHLSSETAALVSRTKSADKVVLITDSMEGTGCSDGQYSIAGNPVVLKNGKAYTHDGAIAGSTLELLDGVKNYALFADIGFEKALVAATLNPASLLCLNNVGSIEVGKKADFVVLSENLTVDGVYIDGKIIK